MVPIRRSTYARCHGECGADSICLIPIHFHLLDEVMPEDAVTVTQQIARSALPREGLPELLRRPFGSRMRGDSKMHNPPTLVREHQKYIQNLKPNRRHGEEIHGHQTTDVVFEECPPCLGWRFPAPHQVL